jgi:hypothetical protein
MTGEDPTDPRGLNPARVPVIILGILLILSVILGISTGTINERTLAPPAPTTSITVP